MRYKAVGSTASDTYYTHGFTLDETGNTLYFPYRSLGGDSYGAAYRDLDVWLPTTGTSIPRDLSPLFGAGNSLWSAILLDDNFVLFTYGPEGSASAVVVYDRTLTFQHYNWNSGNSGGPMNPSRHATKNDGNCLFKGGAGGSNGSTATSVLMYHYNVGQTTGALPTIEVDFGVDLSPSFSDITYSKDLDIYLLASRDLTDDTLLHLRYCIGDDFSTWLELDSVTSTVPIDVNGQRQLYYSHDGTFYYSHIQEGTNMAVLQSIFIDIVNTVREGMVFNFEDDNFTFMDASRDLVDSLEPVACMKFQYDPGWQTRWDDLETAGTEWADLQQAGTKWSDFYSGNAERNLYWLTKDNLLVSDQFAKTDGLKDYYLTREQIDFSDVVQDFRTDKWIYSNQLYFHAESDTTTSDANLFTIAVGWQDTLNDEPTWPAPTELNLQDAQNGGKVKHDYRATGRYLSLRMTFNKTQAVAMTGAEIDIVQKQGR